MFRKFSLVTLACISVPLLPVPAFSLTPQNEGESALSVVASGLVEFNGIPAAGVEVTAFASPDDDALEAAGPTGMGLLPLASGVTSAHGRFDIRADLSSIPADYVANVGDGTDVKLLVTGDSGSIVWNYTVFPEVASTPGETAEPGLRTVTAGAATADTRDGLGDTLAPEFEFDLGKGTAVEVGNEPEDWVDDRGRPLSARAAEKASKAAVVDSARGLQRYAKRFFAASASQRKSMLSPGEVADQASLGVVAAGCGVQWWSDEYKRNIKEHYVNVYSASGIPVRVTQGTSSETSHTMGIALEKGGNWSASGTRTRTYSHKVSQSGVIDAKVYNRVNYRNRVTSCLGDEWMQVSMYDWFTDFAYAPHVNFSYCSSKAAGAEWATGSATNKTYAGGVSFPTISLSARSGYGASQDLFFNFTRAGKICGNNVNGPLSSSQVSARH